MVNSASKKYLDSMIKSKPIDKSGKTRLDIAEGLFELPKRFIKKLHNTRLCDISSLPDRNCTDLKNSISKFLSLRNDNISVFSGSDEIIEIIPRIYLNQNDTSLCLVPTFSRMVDSPKKVGATVKLFALEKDHGFRLEDKVLGDFIDQIKSIQPKTIWICSPNNPTGIVIELNKIKRLISEFSKSLFVINEVYQEYNSLNPQKSSVSLIKDNSNLLIIRSFSKAFGLAGARIGYVVAHQDRIQKIEKFRTMYNTSVISQKLAVEAISDTKYVFDLAEFVKTERERVLNALFSNCKNIELVAGSSTNLLLVRHKNKDLFQELLNKGAIASDWRNSEGIQNQGYVRISIGQKKYNDKIINLFRKIN